MIGTMAVVIEKKTLGARIREARKAKKLNLNELGRLIDPPLSRSAIWQWEADMTTPTVENLSQVASILGVTLEWLDGGGNKVWRSIHMAPGPEGELVDLKKLPPDQAKLLTAMMSGHKKAEVWRLISCDMMSGPGFSPGDYVVVDLAAPPESGKIVLAESHGVPIFRMLFKPHLYALPKGPQPAPLVVDHINVIVKGVVLHRHTFP
jgi:transcriptional regulator with XRE-family HTH domain